MRLLSLVFGAWLLCGAAQAQPVAATLLQALPVPTTAAAGVKPRELSGLAWSPDGQTLSAVSDRGRLFRWQLRWSQGLIDGLQPLSVHTLAHDGQVLNAEALAWQTLPTLPTPTLVVADEAAPQVWPVSPDGVLGPGQPLPAPLRDSDARRGSNNGVEGLAWHPVQGWLAAAATAAARDARGCAPPLRRQRRALGPARRRPALAHQGPGLVARRPAAGAGALQTRRRAPPCAAPRGPGALRWRTTLRSAGLGRARAGRRAGLR